MQANWDACGGLLQAPRGVLVSEVSGWEGDEGRCALFRALSCRAVCARGVLPKCLARSCGSPPRGCCAAAGLSGSSISTPTPQRIAPAEVIWCALLFPVRGLGSRRMALWGSSESGSWREVEQRGRKTLAFHSSFSQFILRDQLHAIRQLGVLFSFQLCTVGEAGKVIFFSLFYCSMMLL